MGLEKFSFWPFELWLWEGIVRRKLLKRAGLRALEEVKRKSMGMTNGVSKVRHNQQKSISNGRVDHEPTYKGCAY
jgi:hypothetical protein